MAKTTKIEFKIGKKELSELEQIAARQIDRALKNIGSLEKHGSGIRVDSLELVDAELERARKLHPPSVGQSLKLFDALVEEVGELAKARMEYGRDSVEARIEATHVACVAIRIIEEGAKS